MIFCVIASLASSIELYVVIVSHLRGVSDPGTTCRLAMPLPKITSDWFVSASGERVEERLEPGVASGRRTPVVVHDVGTPFVKPCGKFTQADVDDARRRREQMADRGRRCRRRGRRSPRAAQNGQRVPDRRGVVAQYRDAGALEGGGLSAQRLRVILRATDRRHDGEISTLRMKAGEAVRDDGRKRPGRVPGRPMAEHD